MRTAWWWSTTASSPRWAPTRPSWHVKTASTAGSPPSSPSTSSPPASRALLDLGSPCMPPGAAGGLPSVDHAESHSSGPLWPATRYWFCASKNLPRRYGSTEGSPPATPGSRRLEWPRGMRFSVVPGGHLPTPARVTGAGELLAKFVNDGQAPVFTEGARGDLDADGALAPLVLVAVDHGDHPLHRGRVEAPRHDVRHAQVALDVTLQDGVQHVVGGQRVLIGLPRPELRRRRPRKDTLGDDLATRARVRVLGEPVDEHLRAILDDREAPRHVAVERGVPHRDLTLVPRVEHQPAELVRQGHQVVAPDARLEILFRHVFLESLERPREHPLVRLEHTRDGYAEKIDAEVLGETNRVVAGARGGERRGHGDPGDVGRPQRIHGHRGHDRRVDAARQADHHVFEAVLGHVVARAEDEGAIDLLDGLEGLHLVHGQLGLLARGQSGQRDAPRARVRLELLFPAA